MVLSEAIILPRPGAAELIEEPAGEPRVGQLRLRTRCTLMSAGTESTVFAGRFEAGTHWARYAQFPFRPGYACVADGEQAGTRVAVRAPHASHVLADADRCVPVPADLPDEQAVWFALAKIAFVGIRVGNVRPGSRVLIVGAGPIGQMTVRWAAAAAASDVVVVDMVAQRLGLALAGGATATVAGALDDMGEEISGAFAGDAPDIVIDATGHPAALPGALRAAADKGTVVLLGDAGFPSQQHLTSDVIVRGVRIAGAHDAYTIGDARWDNDREIVRLFFRLATTGRFPLDGLTSHRFTPDACQRAYELAATARQDAMGIVFDWLSAR